ncbi:MAG: hypothetical protein ABI296_05405 [Gammaproteobacteria bacterium]
MQVYKQLAPIFQVDHMYLQDMAVVSVPDPRGNKKNDILVPLRLSALLTNESALTWYGKYLGFMPADCDKWQSHWNTHVHFSQDTEEFKKAGEFLRTTPLTLKNLSLRKDSRLALWIKQMCDTYFSSRVAEAVTLRELATVVFDNQKKYGHGEDKTAGQKAFDDLGMLHDLMEWGKYDNELMKKDKESEQAVHIKNYLPVHARSISVKNSVATIMKTRIYAFFKHPDDEEKEMSASKIEIKKTKAPAKKTGLHTKK